MPNERPLLTIAIPTYKRSGCLRQLLESLEPQVANERRVELVISDNASPDDTSDVVESFRKRGLAIAYSQNATNIGPDANFVRCFEMARGEYVWIFSDDDMIVSGGLQEVLRYLETRSFDLIHIHAAEFTTHVSAPAFTTFRHRHKVFSSPLEFALYVHTGITFISSNITRKSALGHIADDTFKKMIGTNLAQLTWTLSLLRSNPKCLSINDNLVASRVQNSGGYSHCEIFGRNLQLVLHDFFGEDGPIGRAILNRTIQVWFPWAMMERRLDRMPQHLPEEPRTILGALFHCNFRYWFFVYPLLRLPLPLARMWHLTVRVINRLDRHLGYPISR